MNLIWEQIDVDGSGEIDYSEWALAAANKEKLLTDKRLQQAFTMFDLDKSGFISADELHEVLDPITKTKTQRADWKQIISDIDENGDGVISFKEFKSIMIELIMGTTADVIEYRKSLKMSVKTTAEGVTQEAAQHIDLSSNWPES